MSLRAGVLPYANEVFSGERKYLLELPVVPGCGAIGRVRAFGPDATHLAVGDWVHLRSHGAVARRWAKSPTSRCRAGAPRGEGGQRLQNYFHHGPFAEQMLVPTENAIRDRRHRRGRCRAMVRADTLLVPYGGLLAANLQAGRTLLVSGATGNFGSAAVAVALAMGAGCVVAPGRNERC